MKTLSFLWLLVCTTQFAFAQKCNFGLKAGLNANEWYLTSSQTERPDLLASNKIAISYELGATASQKLCQKFRLNEEVLYSQRNTISRTSINANQDFTTKYGYIAVPIFVSYNVYKPLSIDFGGEYSRAVNSSSAFYKVLFSNRNFANALVGLRYNICTNFDVHARYLHPLSKISEIQWTDYNGQLLNKSKLRSRTFSLAVGYNF